MSFQYSKALFRTRNNLGLPREGNLVCDFDPASLARGHANNGLVQEWVDSISGMRARCHNLPATNPGGWPIFQASALNGLPSLKFTTTQLLRLDGENSKLHAAIQSRNYTIYIAFKSLGDGAGAVQYGTLFGSYDNNTGIGFILNTANATSGRYNAAAFQWRVPLTAGSFSTVYSSCTASFPQASFTGMELAGINGCMIASGANQGKAAATPLLIGANYPGTAFARLNAEIYRIFIWDTPLNPVELLQVEIWLRDRYAQAYPWASAPAFTVFHGDSIMQGTAAGGTDGDINATAPYKAAQTLGLSLGQWMNLGIPGIQTRTMDSLAPSWVDPLPALLGKYVNLVAFEWYNEAVPFGDPTPYNDGVTYLANRKAASSKFRIAWGTSTDTSQGIVNNTRRSAYNSAWDSAHANVDSYISIHTDGNVGDTNAFTNHPTNFSGDGVHLTGTGYTALGTLLSNGVTALPTVYEIVGPSGGAHGVASSAFTVNLSKMSALNDTITLTASEGTITATAAGATITGNGTGTVQVQMPANMFTFTFTYTPGTAGAKTITPTNGQAWTDPAASNYTAS